MPPFRLFRQPSNLRRPAAELHQTFRESDSWHYSLYLLKRAVANFLEPDDDTELGITGEGSHHRRPNLDLLHEAFRYEVAKRPQSVRGYKKAHPHSRRATPVR